MEECEDVFLVVDDEPDMCWALVHILRKNGFASKVAKSGYAALSLIKRHRFRAIFLDAKLPDIEGLELVSRIRKFDPAVRIVMISGYFYKDDKGVQQALDEGLLNSFIAKPFLNDEILKEFDALKW